MTSFTADHRQRLEPIRGRIANARAERNRTMEQRDAAQEAGDLDARATSPARCGDTTLHRTMIPNN
jgi:hypothetical protein